MSDSDELSEALARRLAEHSLEALKASRTFALQQHTDSFKWIMASLLAINSGGVFALLNFDKIDVFSKRLSGSLFVVGILLSILVAVAAQKVTARILPLLNERIGFWLSVLEDGKIPHNLMEIEAQATKAASRHLWVVPAIGWVSAACFAAAVALIGVNLKPDGSEFASQVSDTKSIAGGK